MRLGLVGEGFIERAALMTGLLPEPVVTTFWGILQSRTVEAGLRLGIFEALRGGPLDAAEVAASIGADRDATEVLLDALNGFDLLSRKARRYGLRRVSRNWLLAGPSSMVDMLLFIGELHRELARADVEERVRTGRSPNFHQEGRPPEFWKHYMRGLASMARLVSPELVRRLPVKEPKNLLDVGGGHGIWSVAMVRRHPGLRAMVLDLPPACVQGRLIVGEQGVGDRVAHIEGDLRTGGWAQGQDLVFLFNVLHNLSEEECASACRSAWESLRPGGSFVILEGERPGTDGDLKTPEGVNELFFYLLSGSRVWPEPKIRGWLSDAGFEPAVRRIRLFTLPMTLLLVARRPG